MQMTQPRGRPVQPPAAGECVQPGTGSPQEEPQNSEALYLVFVFAIVFVFEYLCTPLVTLKISKMTNMSNASQNEQFRLINLIVKS